MKRYLLPALLLFVSFMGCASWQSMNGSEKYRACVSYYQAFSAGLHAAAALLPPEYSGQANAVLSVADRAVSTLAMLVDVKASSQELDAANIKAAAAIESANAAVGAAS